MQRWLLLVHQLPAHPSNLRVRTWRRLQQLGAIALKQAVYVLPSSPAAQEDFEWLRAEIESAGGDATVFSAEALDEGGDAALADEFRRAREADYTALAKEIQHAVGRRPAKRSSRLRPASRLRKNFERFRQRFAAIERVDFFGSPGRDRVLALLAELDAGRSVRRDSGRQPSGPAGQYRRRLWVTRPRPGIDRIGSAWLIGRFIDPEARFGFAADAKAAPADALPFDMFGVEFSHHGDRCTFETLCERFGIRDGAVDRLATIVHDLDLKDDRYGAPEAATVGAAIDGLQLAYADDERLLEEGRTLFEALYRGFQKTKGKKQQAK